MLIDKKICSATEAKEHIVNWQQLGLEVVFTNGCFDILHAGHVQYLYSAAALGNKLIVGLNSDSSVKQLKGEKRPIVSQNERAIVLAGLGCIDLVVIFDETTPLSLIEFLNPDVLAKGGDYEVGQIVGAEWVVANGGTVLSLPFLEGVSTTKITEKILRNS